jgi:AAA ATPase domain
VNVSPDGYDGNVPQREPPFIGRSSDHRMLEAVLSRLRSGLSAALVVSGEAGIGKTWLLQYAIRQATDVRSVVVAGHESEIGLAFAGLHRLVSPFLSGVRGIPEPQRDALTRAFELAVGPPPDRFLVGLATMTLLVRVAAGRSATWPQPSS